MKKRAFAVAFGLALLAASGMAALAENDGAQWAVSFTDENKLISNYTASGLSSKVFEMQPGDTVDLTLSLNNYNAGSSNWYMANEVLQTLEESRAAAAGGAYAYLLTYAGPQGTERTLYDSERVGGELDAPAAPGQVGLKTATEALKEYLYLDTLGPGQQGAVRLRVSLDGESQGNEYQSTLARLQLNFAVDPVTEYTEVRTEETLTVVRTGDNGRALPFVLLSAISGLLLLLFGLYGLAEQKRLKKAAQRLACLALAGLLSVSAPAAFGLSARAADGGEQPPDGAAAGPAGGLRSYIVRLYPGAQGTLQPDAVTVSVPQGGSAAVQLVNGVYEVTAPYGATVDFKVDETQGITLPQQSKYYVQGVRESGMDNGVVGQSSFYVTCDADYVVAYGIKGRQVAYTLRFVDPDGNELAPEVVRHGNIGDKPVVAYRYIEGYRPRALNLTKTLDEDESRNIFTFEYDPLEANVIIQTVVGSGGVVVEGGGGAVPGGPAAGSGGEELPEEGTPLGPPEEVVDLDEPGIPLAGLLRDFATNLSSLPLSAKVALAGGIIALGALLILVINKKRERQDAVQG